MSYGHANCQRCGRPTFVHPEVGEDESWVICERCVEDGVAVNWPEYAAELEAEVAVLERMLRLAYFESPHVLPGLITLDEDRTRWLSDLRKRAEGGS